MVFFASWHSSSLMIVSNLMQPVHSSSDPFNVPHRGSLPPCNAKCVDNKKGSARMSDEVESKHPNPRAFPPATSTDRTFFGELNC